MDFSRDDISFESAGQPCRGWLYLPAATGPHPVIVMAHGFGAVKEMGLDRFAERFAQAGYACLVFDYRHFGSSDGEPRQLLDIERQLQDWASAITFVRGHDELDRNRVGLWGTSFAGGHVIETAARDGSVATVISQCPFTDGPASVRVMEFRTLLKVSWLALRDAIGSLFGRQPVLVPSAGEPGSTAMMTAPDVVPGYLGLVPDGFEFRNEVAARIALHVIFCRPGRSAAKIECPALFCVCDEDSVAPAQASLRHLAKSPHGEIKRYPYGHFDIYVDKPFEHVIADQLDFMRRHLPATGS
jgi:pimeloyl-ACP methyl ester carboxylesterase